MSNINQIADLLRSAIKNRQTLAIGTAQAAIYQGQTGLFTTASGAVVNAIAANFCYDSCLLSKVGGIWYAINPRDSQTVVATTVNRFDRTRRRPPADDIATNKWIGVNNLGNGGRKLIYDFDINLTELLSEASLTFNLSFSDIFIDNVVGSDESDLAIEYWRIVVLEQSFFSIDSNGVSNDYPTGSRGNLTHAGGGYFFSTRAGTASGDDIALPAPWNNLPFTRIYSPLGIESSTQVLIDHPLEQPTAEALGIYPNPCPATAQGRPRSIVGDYYTDINIDSNPNIIAFDNALAAQVLQTVPFRIVGIIRVLYHGLGDFTNSKLPILRGQKTLSKRAVTPTVQIAEVSQTERFGNEGGFVLGSLTYEYTRNDSSITYDIDGLVVGIDREEIAATLEPDNYELIGTNTILLRFLTATSFRLEILLSRVVINRDRFDEQIVSTAYAEDPVYTRFKSGRLAIVTDEIRNCRFTNIIPLLRQDDPLPERRGYTIGSANYVTNSTFANSTSFRGVVFICEALFNPSQTIILKADDCYAKIYRTILTGDKLHALEFWVSELGEINLVNIHERTEALSGEESATALNSAVYYPGVQ